MTFPVQQFDERPSRDVLGLQVARLFSQRGTCFRAKVGAAVVLDGRVLVTGYNGPPANLAHCSNECFSSNVNGCTRSVHAEANCIAYAARHGISINRATIYCTHVPCRNCAELIINSGLSRVVYAEDYRLHDGLNLLRSAGVDLEKLDMIE